MKRTQGKTGSSLRKTSAPKLQVKLEMIDYDPNKHGKLLKDQYTPVPKGLSSSSMYSKTISHLIEFVRKEDHKIKIQQEKKKNIEKTFEHLYKRKTFSMDYKTKEEIKRLLDENKMNQELAECTFRPIIYSHNNSSSPDRRYGKIDSIIDIHSQDFHLRRTYDNQMNWERGVRSKKDKDKSKTRLSEMQSCTFTPKLSVKPNFEISKSNKNLMTQQNKLFYQRNMRARRWNEEKKLKLEIDYTAKYDQRKRRSDITGQVGYNEKKNKLRVELHKLKID